MTFTRFEARPELLYTKPWNSMGLSQLNGFGAFFFVEILACKAESRCWRLSKKTLCVHRQHVQPWSMQGTLEGSRGLVHHHHSFIDPTAALVCRTVFSKAIKKH